ncbi:hypothetical protein [Allonocardiopsis opalescens]|uniref:Uncharacterized protein n=1 Tax=Allonocardiopsis opalescens TaxID=1144618 RepID=A0A2T0Q4G4_9ACTN|nr:hypothetical protein [Allonocardiopsis opalescens]PRX98707.1 hypothetical protein CLV72_104286 [Allonocardiopsis opalescens]
MTQHTMSSTDNEQPIQSGDVTASYFWDDGSGINGDTGAPASGEPMQEGLAASPSWPLGTEGYVEYEGQTAEFFIGDRGPGDPSEGCDILLDLDGRTFAELTGGDWNDESLVVENNGGMGHIDVTYHITKWGDGAGTEGAPHVFNDPGDSCEEVVTYDAETGVGEPPSSGEEQQDDGEQQDEPQQAAAREGGDGGEAEQAAADEQEDASASPSAAAPQPTTGAEAAAMAPVADVTPASASATGLGLGLAVLLVALAAILMVTGRRVLAAAGRHVRR